MEELRAARRARLGSDRQRQDLGARVVRQVVRVRERPVPPEHLGRAAVGIGGAAQRASGRPGQSVPRQPGRADEHLPGHLRSERAVLAERTVPQPEQQHGVHHRPHVERHGRAAGGRAGSFSAGYVGSRTNNIWESTPLNNGLFVPVNGAAPSAANLNARRPLTLADPVQRQVLRAAGSVCHRRQAALQRHAAVGPRQRRATARPST